MAFVCLMSIHSITLAQGKDAARVVVISSMEKLRSDQTPEKGSGQVSLSAARGEAESSQLLVVAPEDRALRNVTVKAAPLRNLSGATLDLTVSLVGYVNIPLPTPDGYNTPGDYPDILYPLKSFEVAAGKNQSVWLTSWVPRDAQPGVYEGAIAINDDRGLIARVPVSVRVYSAVLPKQALLKTAFGYGPWEIEKPKYYGASWAGSEKEEAFLRQMISYRMTPVNNDIGGTLRSLKDAITKDVDGQWKADWTAFDQEVEKRQKEGWTQFFLSHLPLSWWNPDSDRNLTVELNRWGKVSQDEQGQILRLLNAHLVEKKWAHLFAYKCFDEPSINPNNEKFIREFADFFHENAPDLRLLMITTDCREKNLAKEYPLYTWVPHLPGLDLDPGYEEFLKERQKMGEQAWFYICETRTFHEISQRYADAAPIDRTGTSQRSLGWLAWRNHLDGFLYWNVTAWDYRGGYDHPENAHKGEGVLFYPDLKNHGVPFPSIRAELLRDGFEDYDLLFLLNQKIARLEAKSNLNASQKKTLTDAKGLLDISDLAPNLRDFNRDPSAYEGHHNAVLKALANLEQIEPSTPDPAR